MTFRLKADQQELKVEVFCLAGAAASWPSASVLLFLAGVLNSPKNASAVFRRGCRYSTRLVQAQPVVPAKPTGGVEESPSQIP